VLICLLRDAICIDGYPATVVSSVWAYPAQLLQFFGWRHDTDR